MSRRVCALGLALLTGGIVAGSAASAEPQTAAAPAFAGRWRLNRELSDKPAAAPAAARAEKPAEGAAKEGAGASPARPEAGKSSEPPADPSAEFTVTQTELEIVARDASGQSRSFYPNGKSYKADDGTANIRSFWKDGALVFEKKSDRGWKYSETWQVTPDGRLKVQTRIGGGGQRAGATTRVYDRVPATEAAPKVP